MSKRKQYPSQERLRELFDYDPEGFLVWRYRPDATKRWNARLAGKMAGYKTVDSMTIRHRVDIGGCIYKYIDLLWIYFYGAIPDDKYVKTKSGAFELPKPEDLKLSDAEYAKHVGNYLTNNVYGVRGVRKQKGEGGYQAILDGQGLGTFSTPQAAGSAWIHHAKKKYGDGVISHNVDVVDFEKFRVTKGQQLQGTKRSDHKYRGVMPNRNNWMARIGVNSKLKYLGTFKTPEQAARAYNRAARDHYGEHAVLNDVPDPFGEDQDLPF